MPSTNLEQDIGSLAFQLLVFPQSPVTGNTHTSFVTLPKLDTETHNTARNLRTTTDGATSPASSRGIEKGAEAAGGD